MGPCGLWPSSISQVLGRGTSFPLFLYCKVRLAQIFHFSFIPPLFNQQTWRTYFLPDVVPGLITQNHARLRDTQSRWIEMLQAVSTALRTRSGRAKGKQEALSSSDQGRLHRGVTAEWVLRRRLAAWQTNKVRWRQAFLPEAWRKKQKGAFEWMKHLIRGITWSALSLGLSLQE